MAFERVLIGFDGSPSAIQTLALARRLCSPDAQLLALTVAETHLATHAGMDAVAWDEEIRATAEQTRLAAEQELSDFAGAQARFVCGHPAKQLLGAADAMGADLIAIGSRGHRRFSSRLLGSVAMRIAQNARCSVLIARGESEAGEIPRSIAIGVDSSPECRAATAVGRAVATATRARVHEVPADASPARTLLAASRSNDLLVIGPRSAHGVHALGSVTERLANEAACPVLIVRTTSGSASPDASRSATVRA
jgi:nucleotide-binding universal stress UspA family protein